MLQNFEIYCSKQFIEIHRILTCFGSNFIKVEITIDNYYCKLNQGEIKTCNITLLIPLFIYLFKD